MPSAIANIHHFLLVLMLIFIPSSRAQGLLPEFRKNQYYKFSVKEGIPGQVGQVSIDRHGYNTILELDKRGQKILTINSTSEPSTANLTLITPLDRELKEIHHFTVFLKFNISRIASVKNFTLKVLDVNDNAPEFITMNPSFDVECYDYGYNITQVKAIDKDSGKNGQIVYIMDKQSKNLFSINSSSGVIRVKTRNGDLTSHKINITAKDQGYPSLGTSKIIKIRFLANKRTTALQWSLKGHTIDTIQKKERSCSMSITKGTENSVITADQHTWNIKVNRLISERPNTLFCLVIKVTCVGKNESLIAINTKVVKNTSTELRISNISLKSTVKPTSTYLERLENRVDSCVRLSYNGSTGQSRATCMPPRINIINIHRRYFVENERDILNHSDVIGCILANSSLKIMPEGTTPPQHETTTSKPPTSPPRSYTPITTNPNTTFRTSSTISPPKTSLIIASVLGVLLAIIVIFLLVHCYRRKMDKRREENEATEMTQIDGRSKTPWREIDKGFIATGKELGTGFFGVVLQGTVILDGQSKQCAVKMLKQNATEADNKDLVNELHIIARIGHHPNIINLIGACTKTVPVYIVLEFASNGNLLDYLRQNREETYSNMTSLRPDIKLDLRTRLKIAYEVAQGMRHLSSKKCVHRDLAARNVLLDEHYVAKVTDFGLSRNVYEEGIYQINSQSKMPLKWMAIESLETTMFTTQSDVWSFGVLLWEIETGGATPYPGLMGREIFQELAAGHRLEQPSKCPDSLYELMSSCWIRDPTERPSFQELCSVLESFLQTEAGYEDLDKIITIEPSDSGSTKIL